MLGGGVGNSLCFNCGGSYSNVTCSKPSNLKIVLHLKAKNGKKKGRCGGREEGKKEERFFHSPGCLSVHLGTYGKE